MTKRRVLVSLLAACLLGLLAVSFACSRKSNPPDLNRRIERMIRSTYGVAPGTRIEVGPRTASEFTKFDTVSITLSSGSQKQSKDFLLSKDGNTLIAQTKLDLTKDPYAEIMAKIDTADRPFRGNKDAKVVLVNYDDFQCPFCARMHQTLFSDIMKTYGDRVKLIYKDYPLDSIHPWAHRAAVDSNCLAAQSNDAYWGFADYAHANAPQISGDEHRPVPEQIAAVDRVAQEQGQKFKLDMSKLSACLQAQPDEMVKASVQEADKLGVRATPTVFINGFKLDGARPVPELRAAIDLALRDASDNVAAASASK